MTIEALIVAAGRGTRAGGGVPKQYRLLRGEPILRHTLRALLADARITSARVVIHADDTERYKAVAAGLGDPRLQPRVVGRDTRSGSVRAGLAACDAAHVLIHDAARPLLAPDTLGALIDRLLETGAACVGVPVADALWRVDGDVAQVPVPRDGLWRAQTPQAFRTQDIRTAHDAATADHADDVETARAHGIAVTMVAGSDRNLKITRPADFELAETLMGETMDIRTGQGFDVHAFTDGDAVILNGVAIPHEAALKGHSDADVAMHAITDAIFGALAEGDIGQWFPPSEPEWKGAASEVFLRKAIERVAARGFRVTNIDNTIICEAPKIGPHATDMRNELARITGVALDRISVKATTTEERGFTGRREGIAALATVTLVSP